MDYKTKKEKNQVLKKMIQKKVSEKTYKRIENCCHFLVFAGDKKLEKKKVILSNNCENRFCPICATKKSRKDALQISIMIKYLQEKYQFLFLTLTAPNVKNSELESEIKSYNESFKRMAKLSPFKNAVKGYVRKLEVTYNKKEKSYHPHFHVLLAVNKSYFDSKNYIKRDKWLEMWQNSKRDMLITQVDVRKFDMKKGSFELAAYTAKDSDYLYSQKVFDTIYKVLKGKQIITYNGIFKETLKKYKSGELDYLKDIDNTEYIYRIIYEWVENKYVEKELRELTQDEKEYLNKFVDEIDVE